MAPKDIPLRFTNMESLTYDNEIWLRKKKRERRKRRTQKVNISTLKNAICS